MAPRKPSIEEQQAAFQQTLEAFTARLHDALQHAIENAMNTVLQNQQQHDHDPRAEEQ